MENSFIMTSHVDKNRLASALAMPELTELKLPDVFHHLWQDHPINIQDTQMHAPRKYHGRYKQSKRSYKTSLVPFDHFELAWKDLILETAFNMAFLDFERKLTTVKAPCDVKDIVLPHKIFSWSIQDCIERLDLTEDRYVDLVNLDHESEALNEIKLQMDITQILEIFNHIANEFMDNEDLQKEIIPTLIQYCKQDEYKNKLTIQCEHATQQHRRLMEKYNRNLIFSPAKVNEEPKKVKLQEVNMESDASIPIHDRYKVNSFKTDALFKKLKNELAVKKTLGEIVKLNYISTVEEECLESKLTMYHAQVTNYMQKYDMLSNKYDIDYDNADNEVGLLRTKINKAHEDLRFFKDQVVFFKKSVKETLEIIEREELEEQLRLDLGRPGSIKKNKHTPTKNKK